MAAIEDARKKAQIVLMPREIELADSILLSQGFDFAYISNEVRLQVLRSLEKEKAETKNP